MKEVIAADRKIWGTISDLVEGGWSLDDALLEMTSMRADLQRVKVKVPGRISLLARVERLSAPGSDNATPTKKAKVEGKPPKNTPTRMLAPGPLQPCVWRITPQGQQASPLNHWQPPHLLTQQPLHASSP